MKISVITAVYNQASTIQRTIDSIARQSYRNFEYIIVDAGSTDGTREIIDKNRHVFSKVVFEPDDGQYFGICKGLDLATGDVLCWLNGDDIFFPWTFEVVAKVFGGLDVSWISGIPCYANKHGEVMRVSNTVLAYPKGWIRAGLFNPELLGAIQQESTFWRRSLWERVGGLDLRYDLAADFDLWRRFSSHAELVHVAAPLAAFSIRKGEQRSSVQYGKYLFEVLSSIDGPLVRSLTRVVSRLGVQSLVKIIRAFMMWRAKVIYYSFEKDEWVLASTVAPISRNGIAVLPFLKQTEGR